MILAYRIEPYRFDARSRWIACQKPPDTHHTIVEGDLVNNRDEVLKMRAYRVEVKGQEDTIVFAGTMDHAAEIFATYWLRDGERSLPDFRVGWLGFSPPHEGHEQLEEALERRVCGIATFHPDDGWQVDAPY